MTHSASHTVPTATLYLAWTQRTLSHSTKDPQCQSHCANRHTVSGMDTVDTHSTNNTQCQSQCANSHTVSGMDTVDTQSFHQRPTLCQQPHSIWHGHSGHSVIPPKTHSASHSVPAATLYLAWTQWTLSHSTIDPQCQSHCASVIWV